MKVFRDLYLYITPQQENDFFEEIKKTLPEGWKRETELEKESHRESGIKYYFFSCSKNDEIEDALIALARKNAEVVYIANIVPKKIGELGIEKYNKILMYFYENILLPVCQDRHINIEVTSDQQSMEDWVSISTYEKLKRFSAVANKSTGTAHPSDQERWFDFVISVIENNDSLSTDQLRRWLIEEEGWPSDIVAEMVIEFEQEIALLKYYKKIIPTHE